MLSAIEPEDEVGLVARLVDGFLADTPGRLGAPEVAAATGNGPEVADLTDRLKGAASELGATAFASVCKRLGGSGPHPMTFGVVPHHHFEDAPAARAPGQRTRQYRAVELNEASRSARR